MGNKNTAQSKKRSEVETNNQRQVTPPWTAGTEVVALYAFEASEPEELTFGKDEVLEVDNSTLGRNWYRAQNAQGHIGYIPSNYVKERAAVKLHAIPWFHGRIARKQTEELLKPHEDGLFLVRESNYYDGDYTLSVRIGHKVEHYRIRRTADGNFTIDDVTFFKTLTQLVEHYEEGADGLSTRLVKRLERKEGTLDFFAFDVDPDSFRKEGWTIPQNDLHLGRSIEKEEFVDVFLAKYRGQKVCVKSPSDSKHVRQLLLEAAIMTYVNTLSINKWDRKFIPWGYFRGKLRMPLNNFI